MSLKAEKEQIVDLCKKIYDTVEEHAMRNTVKQHWNYCLANPGSHSELILDLDKYCEKVKQLSDKLSAKQKKRGVCRNDETSKRKPFASQSKHTPLKHQRHANQSKHNYSNNVPSPIRMEHAYDDQGAQAPPNIFGNKQAQYWECQSCTFINSTAFDTCRICSDPQPNSVGAHNEQPLQQHQMYSNSPPPILRSAPAPEYTPYELGTIYKYRWIDCQDEYNKWYEAQIIDISPSQRKIKVHYKGWSSKYDTWVDLNAEPERVRLLHTFTTKPKVTGTLSSYHVGTKCDCLDPKDKWYQAEIVQVNEENGLVKIHYNGWDKRYDEWINKDSYRIAPRRRNKISPRKSKPKRNTSSPMDRNVTINNYQSQQYHSQRRRKQPIPKPMPQFPSPYKSNYKYTPQPLFGDSDQDNGRQSWQMFSRQAAVKANDSSEDDDDGDSSQDLPHLYSAWQPFREKKRSLDELNRTYECPICMETYKVAEDAFLMNCDHILNRKCALKAFKADIMTYKRLPQCPQCQTENVKTEITPQQLELLLDDQTLGFYRNLSLAQGLKGSNYFQCPTADCQNGAELIGNDVLLFRCESCKFSSCTRCRGPYHPNELCEELLNEKRLEALAKQKGWKPCPKCGIIIERIVGCFHMKCKNPQCGAEYCDQCGAQLDPENWRVHFNPPNKCKLWMDENDLLYLD